jgi:hypothetical protein
MFIFLVVLVARDHLLNEGLFRPEPQAVCSAVPRVQLQAKVEIALALKLRLLALLELHQRVSLKYLLEFED